MRWQRRPAHRHISMWGWLVSALVCLAALAPKAAEAQATTEERGGLVSVPGFPIEKAPPKLDAIRFSHRQHLATGVECADCHPDALEATDIAGTETPKEAFCFECHDRDRRKECGLCHLNAESPSATLPSWVTELRFSHAAHLALPAVKCETCHPDAVRSESAEDRLTPTMAACTGCHQADLDRLNCQKCHTRLPERPWRLGRMAIHDAGFAALHGAWAVGSAALCAQCHEQSFCADCHARTQATTPAIRHLHPGRMRIHEGDFIGRHAFAANAKSASCSSCHGTTFCVDCHRRSLARPAGVERSPHPPGYVLRGGEAFHGADARRNVAACASCHDRGAASNCVECHRVGGVGGNPHPPGFRRGLGSNERYESATCTPCHLVGDR